MICSLSLSRRVAFAIGKTADQSRRPGGTANSPPTSTPLQPSTFPPYLSTELAAVEVRTVIISDGRLGPRCTVILNRCHDRPTHTESIVQTTV